MDRIGLTVGGEDPRIGWKQNTHADLMAVNTHGMYGSVETPAPPPPAHRPRPPSRKRLRVIGAVGVTALTAGLALAAVRLGGAREATTGPVSGGALAVDDNVATPLLSSVAASTTDGATGPPASGTAGPPPASALTLQFTDRYTAMTGPYYRNYTFMRGHAALVAAYQRTTMSVPSDGSCDGSSTTPCVYTWAVDGEGVEAASGRNASFTFTQLRSHVVEVTSSGGASGRALVLCRYVRHELRDLFQDDRER